MSKAADFAASTFIAMLATGALVAPGAAIGATVLDANYAAASTNTIIDAGRLSLAQTFTVVNTGTISSVQLLINDYGVPNAGLELQVRTLSGGLPSELNRGASVLATSDVASNAVGSSLSWVTFDFPGFTATAGTQLALVLTSATYAGEYEWNGDLAWPWDNLPAGTYAGGRAFDEGSSALHSTWGGVTLASGNYGDTGNNPALVDFSFKVFETSGAVPEPASWAMLIVGFCGLGAVARARPNRSSAQNFR